MNKKQNKAYFCRAKKLKENMDDPNSRTYLECINKVAVR